jgi:hypothetical protein
LDEVCAELLVSTFLTLNLRIAIAASPPDVVRLAAINAAAEMHTGHMVSSRKNLLPKPFA